MYLSGKCPIHGTLRAYVESDSSQVTSHCPACPDSTAWQTETLAHRAAASETEYAERKLLGTLIPTISGRHQAGGDV